jgi:photosystem II stability/assembly factor-like uncharacterized protein
MQKKAFAAALLYILISTIAVNSQEPSWRVLPGLPGIYDDVYFINPLTGWTASNKVFKTTNGGYNWLQTDSLPEYARSIGFLDEQNGFIGTLRETRPLYRTTDGGTNWEEVQGLSLSGICGISIVDSLTIYACGRYDGNAKIIKSTSGGKSWETINMSVYVTSLVDCYFTTADSGFVVGGIGTTFNNRKAVILFTSDGGINWVQRVISTIEGTWCWKISFPTMSTGYVSIEKLSAGSQSFFKTTNGGVNWMQLPYTNHQQGIGFANELTGWIGTIDNVKETTDGGLNWNEISFGVQYPYLNRIRMFGDSVGYAAGSTIFKYTTDSTIGIAGNSENVPKTHSLHQNYPNPFNPATIIKYEMFQHSVTSLMIYNSAGEEVYRLVSGFRAPGIYELSWDGRDNYGNILPSGVYFYKLETEKYSESKKMVLVR